MDRRRGRPARTTARGARHLGRRTRQPDLRGERQRLALARAVLRDPQLLILDEATNAIDIDGEQIILHRLREACPDTTILMIAHRLESLRRCDRILLFDAGRVVAQGSFETMRSRLVAVERDDATIAALHAAQTQGAS
ncbi:ATP-binding cassette domain-containing protein [Sphingomonas aerolata]|uniref:ATP-binding cassette domain-containing protein n=1 Tax=Sphingomonas aerolata TaxID=185951 RepID=UPI002FE22045